jgi:hydroxymethylpyrimidine/phosphomethylpyrimidine kinase
MRLALCLVGCYAWVMSESKKALFSTSSIEPGPRVLVVGGSDPSGAAGIQADLKTLTALGVYGASAVTAVTVQNQRGVTDVMPLPASLVGAQMDAANSDSPCDVVKTGMLATVDIVHALADRLGSWGSPTRLVLDPVLTSTSGRSLLGDDGKKALIERLIPGCALITPNLLEAQELTGQRIVAAQEMGILADYLLAMGASAVLIKGGHLIDLDPEIDEITDLLRTIDGEEIRFSRPRLKGPGWRGTGCSLASAIAAGIAEGLTLRSAVERGCRYVELAMKESAPYLGVRALNHWAGAHPTDAH